MDVPDDVIAAVSEFAHAALTDDVRGDLFDEATDPGPDADALEQLAAFSGRSVLVRT